MADFNPIAEAKRIMQEVRDGKPAPREYLVDYIDALTAALRDTQWYVDHIADEWDDQTADVLAHTIRHLLDD
jgi:hypothetical protein